MTAKHAIVIALASIALLASAGGAQAIYIVTPLQLSVDSGTANVGDLVRFTLAPQNDTVAAEWAGREVGLWYYYDTAEKDRSEGTSDEPTSDETQRRVAIGTVALDDKASGSYAWTVPAELDGFNAAIRVEDANGEMLGITDVAIGDAEPRMHIMAGEASDGKEVSEDPTGEKTANDPTEAADDARADVPAHGILAGLAALGVVAMALRRK